MRVFLYGMRLRPFSIGCLPMEGLVRAEDDKAGKYHDILVYASPLNGQDVDEYELDYLGEREEGTEQ